jgi:hypothetical protein
MMEPSHASACAAIVSGRADATSEDVDRIIARVRRRRRATRRRNLKARLPGASAEEKRRILQQLSELGRRESGGGEDSGQ